MNWSIIFEPLKKAGYAALAAFIAYLINHFGVPIDPPTPDDLNIVGATPDMVAGAQAVASQMTSAQQAADAAQVRTAISIPLVLFLIDLGFRLFGGKGDKK